MNRIKVLVCVWSLICLTIFTTRLRGQQDGVPDPVDPVTTVEELKPRRSPGANNTQDGVPDPVDPVTTVEEFKPKRSPEGSDSDDVNPFLQLNSIKSNQQDSQVLPKRRARPNSPRSAPPVGAIRLNGTTEPNAVRTRPVLVTRTVNEVIHQEIPAEELEEAERLRSAIKALKELKEDDSAQKEKLMKVIQALLAKQFERDFKQREAALAPLEERVKSLRKQLDKRKSAMDEIVNLRFKTITNEIDGLSFPGEEGAVNSQNGAPTFNPGIPIFPYAPVSNKNDSNDYYVPPGSIQIPTD